MTGFLDSLHQHTQGFTTVLHIWCKPSFIPHIACILTILFLDASLQRVVDLGTDHHGLAEGRGPNRQNHELLTSQSVPGMAAAVDDIEGWNRHDKFVNGLLCQLCNVHIGVVVICIGARATERNGNCQDRVCPKFGLRPTPLIVAAIQVLYHQFINDCLLSHIHANKLGTNNFVDVLDCLADTFPHQSFFVTVSEFQSFVSPCRGPTGHCTAEQAVLTDEIHLYCGIPS
mmetsp:Transcript_122166/g.228148  ORF Transcript_122166/g.228148 Transcript_122166/m.228148 type:complete len:229 (-) Transcript_122166:1495-2181(-)